MPQPDCTSAALQLTCSALIPRLPASQGWHLPACFHRGRGLTCRSPCCRPASSLALRGLREPLVRHPRELGPGRLGRAGCWWQWPPQRAGAGAGLREHRAPGTQEGGKGPGGPLPTAGSARGFLASVRPGNPFTLQMPTQLCVTFWCETLTPRASADGLQACRSIESDLWPS